MRGFGSFCKNFFKGFSKGLVKNLSSFKKEVMKDECETNT